MSCESRDKWVQQLVRERALAELADVKAAAAQIATGVSRDMSLVCMRRSYHQGALDALQSVMALLLDTEGTRIIQRAIESA